MLLYKDIQEFIKTIDLSDIDNKRITLLKELASYIDNEQNIFTNLIFICTHNSRRSILAQVWAQTFASYFNLKEINCYSGGTEATEVYAKIVETLSETGFKTKIISKEKNPVSLIKYSDNMPPIVVFSKKYNHLFNPQNAFCAIMTCSDADSNCPVVVGAKNRISLTYEDPKIFDATDLKTKKYYERNLQIAKEMYFVFSQISSIRIKKAKK